MVKKSGDPKDYIVGYGRPPAATRFSVAHQPPRRKPVTPPRKSTLELSSEQVTVHMDGVTTTMTSDELVDEMMVQRAFEGRLRDLRDLYRRLDAEEDIMLAAPQPLSRHMTNKYLKVLRPIFRKLLEEATELVDLKMAYHDIEGTLKLTPWGKQALSEGPPT